MASLRNQRHENFCQLTVQGAKYGWSQSMIYAKAGYLRDGNSHTAAMAASRLMKRDDIRARIAELTAPAAKKAQVTAETLADQFDRVFEGAFNAAQFGPAGNMAVAKAKLFGFMREKMEIGGVGDFDGCETPEAVIDRLLGEMRCDPRTLVEELRAMASAIEDRLAGMALDMTPPLKAKPSLKKPPT